MPSDTIPVQRVDNTYDFSAPMHNIYHQLQGNGDTLEQLGNKCEP